MQLKLKVEYRKLKSQLQYYSNADFEKYAENFLEYYLKSDDYQKFHKLVEIQKQKGQTPNKKYLRVLEVRRQKGLKIAKAFYQEHDSLFKSIKAKAIKIYLGEIFLVFIGSDSMIRLRFSSAILVLFLIGMGISENSLLSLNIGILFIPLTVWFWWLSHWAYQRWEFDSVIKGFEGGF